MNPQPLIGFAGRARSGKDTCAAALAPLGYKRVGFADTLKECALRVDPYVTGSPSRLSEVVEDWGWEGAKDYFPEVRQFLQRLGTEMRELDRNIWVRPAVLKIESLLSDGYGVAVPDVRFPNEVDAIRRAGGIVVQVVRPDLDSSDDHISETALTGVHFDHVIINDGTEDDLHRLVLQLAERGTPLRKVPRWPDA